MTGQLRGSRPAWLMLVVILLAGSLSACGTDQDPVTPASTTPASAPAPSRSASTPAPPDGAGADEIEDAVSQAQATLDQLEQELRGDAAEATG